MKLCRLTLIWIRAKMKEMADAENYRRDEESRFYYERDSITSLFNFFLDPHDYDDPTNAEFKRDNAFHEPIDMMQINIIGQGPLWIPKPDYVKEREKPKPFTWNDVTRSNEPFFKSSMSAIFERDDRFYAHLRKKS